MQEPPFAIQIEASEGCNLFCDFCGLRGIREKPGNFKFMETMTALRIGILLADAGWNPRVEFAMHGEPTMNKKLHLLVAAIRANLPRSQIMVTSNGGGLLAGDINENIDLLFASGLNVLALDNYESVKIVPKIIEKLKRPINYYPQDPDASPHKRRPVSEEIVIVIQDISKAQEGTHSFINNHAGAAGPKNENAQGMRCAKPFRELSIRWDGSVAICCNDWRGELRIGNVHDVNHIQDIWQHPVFESMRKYLYHGRRELGPCKGCDAVSYRVGLLPDKKGLETLPEPTEADAAAIGAALGSGPLTLPVLRPWELGKPRQDLASQPSQPNKPATEPSQPSQL